MVSSQFRVREEFISDVVRKKNYEHISRVCKSKNVYGENKRRQMQNLSRFGGKVACKRAMCSNVQRNEVLASLSNAISCRIHFEDLIVSSLFFAAFDSLLYIPPTEGMKISLKQELLLIKMLWRALANFHTRTIHGTCKF